MQQARSKPLIYPEINQYTMQNQFTNVLLIDSQVKNYAIFVNSINSTTFPIVYSVMSFKTDLLTLLQTNFTNINRLGIVFTTSLDNTKMFLDRKSLFTNNETEPYSENMQFMINIINEFKVKNIDYLACNTLNYTNWVNYYQILTDNTGVIVSASNDKTGNVKYGEDWIMENTSQDVELIYFTSGIEYYQYLIDNPSWATGIPISPEYPQGFAIDPYNIYMYVADNIGSFITRINMSNPAIKIIWTNQGLNYPKGIVIDNTNTFMYVINANNTITQIQISNPNIYNSTWATSTQGLNSPQAIVIDVPNTYIYVANFGNQSICRIEVSNPTNYISQWAFQGFTLPNDYPTGMSIDKTNNYIYIANYDLNTITQIQIFNPTIYNSTWATSTQGLNQPSSIVIDNTNTYMFVGNGYDASNIIQFRLNSPNCYYVPYNTVGLDTPQGLFIDNTNTYLYVANGYGNYISQLSLSIKYPWAAGTLGAYSQGISIDNGYPQGIAIDNNNNNMYVTNYNSRTITQLQISDNTINNPTWQTFNNRSPTGIAIDNNNTYMYIINSPVSNVSSISRVLISTGVRTNNWVTSTITNPIAVVIDSTNTYMYVANWTNNTISKIHIPSATANTWANSGFDFNDETFATQIKPQGLAIDKTNTYLYVANFYFNSITRILIADPNTYTTWVPDTQGLLNPQGLVIDNTYIYVACNNFISKILLSDPTSYNNSWATSATTLELNNPQGLVIDKSNIYMYVTNGGNNTISKIYLPYTSTEFNTPYGFILGSLFDPTNTFSGCIGIGNVNYIANTVSSGGSYSNQDIGPLIQSSYFNVDYPDTLLISPVYPDPGATPTNMNILSNGIPIDISTYFSPFNSIYCTIVEPTNYVATITNGTSSTISAAPLYSNNATIAPPYTYLWAFIATYNGSQNYNVRADPYYFINTSTSSSTTVTQTSFLSTDGPRYIQCTITDSLGRKGYSRPVTLPFT